MQKSVDMQMIQNAVVGDQGAKMDILNICERTIRFWLVKSGWWTDWDDGLQEGRIVILEKMADYDPSRGATFKTFIGWWLLNRFVEIMHGRRKSCQYDEDRDWVDKSTKIPNKQKKQLWAAVDELPNDEKQVIEGRYAYGKKEWDLQDELGYFHNASIRWIEQKGLKKLRKALSGTELALA